MTIAAEAFGYVRDLVRRESAIVLAPGKEYLVESRLLPLARLAGAPVAGYDRASAIVRDATSSGRSLREVARAHGVEESVLDKALDLRAIARGNT